MNRFMWQPALSRCPQFCQAALRDQSVFTRVRRETGKEQVVQVHCDEGVANHIGPEPCAGIREDAGEASAGVRAGQPLSREIVLISGADAVTTVEGTTEGRVIA